MLSSHALVMTGLSEYGGDLEMDAVGGTVMFERLIKKTVESIKLAKSAGLLTDQQCRALCGQATSGNADGAMVGLSKLLRGQDDK